MDKFFGAAILPVLRASLAPRALIPGDRPSRERLLLDLAACLAITLLAGIGTVIA